MATSTPDAIGGGHASEGRVHPEGPVTMDWARGILCGGVGVAEEKALTDHLHQISVLRVPATGWTSPAWARRLSAT